MTSNTVDYVFLGSQLGRPVLEGIPATAWYDEVPSTGSALRSILQRHRVQVALVVEDPEAADRLAGAGCPVVYVDSLPYLWTIADSIPTSATIYCAQQCAFLPKFSWPVLAKIKRLEFTEAIISARTLSPSARRQSAVINVGGMHSPFTSNGNISYLDTVLDPALTVLAQKGFSEVTICGNVHGDMMHTHPATGVVVRSVSLAHQAFLDLLSETQLLLTSPGMTTLLEASAMGTPTVCLPPQNVSQVLNSEQLEALCGSDSIVRWPDEVLDRTELESVRKRGESAGLMYMYEAIASATSLDGIERKLCSSIEHAIELTRSEHNIGAMASAFGIRGATQVASYILSLDK